MAQSARDVGRILGERRDFDRLRLRENVQREIVAGTAMADERADRRERRIHLPRQRHRAGAVEQDRERHRRVLRLLEHVAAHRRAVHRQIDLGIAQVGDRTSVIAEDRERDHHVADGDRLRHRRDHALRERRQGEKQRGAGEYPAHADHEQITSYSAFRKLLPGQRDERLIVLLRPLPFQEVVVPAALEVGVLVADAGTRVVDRAAARL